MRNWIIYAGLATLAGLAVAQDASTRKFTPEQIKAGAEMYSRNCAPCHGVQMERPEGSFDLKTFPPDQPERFLNSVMNGKNSMPPWRDLLSRSEVDALWAYVVAGEKK